MIAPGTEVTVKGNITVRTPESKMDVRRTAYVTD
jgi:hypothetical protein